jgi:hypothetical protein
MKLVAQRVMQPAAGPQATHAFHYTHGGLVWIGPPPPGLGHGTLQASHVELPPGSNHVLTYLDIIAPDETPTVTILRAFTQIYERGHPPPFVHTIGNCTFSSAMIHAFQLAWRAELGHLYNNAIAARTTLH